MKAQALAVIFGAAAGVGLALVRKADPPPPLPPAAAKGTGFAGPSAAAPPSVPTALASAPSAASALASASAEPARSAAPDLVAPPANLTPIQTPDELTATEIKCYRKDPESCHRAADAYDAGRVVPRDAERARTYRKVELTQLVRGCERDSPKACLVLAERYQSGDGVARSAKQAAALVDRARMLCRRTPTPSECESLKPR